MKLVPNLTLTFGGLGTYHGREANAKSLSSGRIACSSTDASGHGRIATPIIYAVIKLLY